MTLGIVDSVKESSSINFNNLQGTEYNNSNNASSIGTTFPLNVTSGSLLFCIVTWENRSGGALSSVTDTMGNTWIVASGIYQGAGSQDTSIAYCLNAAAGTTTVTANLAVASTWLRICIMEFSVNGGYVFSYDAHSGASTASSTASPSTPSITTTQNNDLVLIAFYDDSSWGSNAALANAPFVGLDTAASHMLPIGMAKGSVGAVSGSFNLSRNTNTPWVAWIIAFKIS